MLFFTATDLTFGEGYAAPAVGWKRHPMPALLLNSAAKKQNLPPPVAWARFQFNRSEIGPGPAAIGLEYVSERFIVNLNGVDIYRNYSDDKTVMFGWNRPWFVPLPPQLLRDKRNIVVIRTDTNLKWNLGVGALIIGPDQEIRQIYEWRYAVRNQWPLLINGVILCLTIAVLILWLNRPGEKGLLWLTLIGGFWWFRNLHIYVNSPPIESQMFWDLSIYAMFALIFALNGFAVNFIEVANKSKIIIISAINVIGLIFVKYTLDSIGRRDISDLVCNLTTVPMAFWIIYILARACWQNPTKPKVMLFCALTIAIFISFHDFGMTQGVWTGTAFYLQPYGSILVYLSWGMALWLRLFGAMNEVELLNATLEQKVLSATEQLRVSEAARRQLEVASAVEQERERLMFEIHDGIGSNLVTALAVAEQQKESPATIKTLKRSLAELRIAVDSLDPIDGDVSLLLGSLRYRLTPELKNAGIAMDWHVEETPPLEWLDATGALHILRILQEAISNTISHAKASRITVRCRPELRDGRTGVAISLSDNGIGLGDVAEVTGKGLSNMRARAEALSGAFSALPGNDGGTDIRLWLPTRLRTAA